MKRLFRRDRAARVHQQQFDFLERTRRRERWFKLVISAAVLLTIAIGFGSISRGRYVVASMPSLARDSVKAVLGIPTSRREIDDQWRRYRLQGIAESAKALPVVYQNAGPQIQRLMRYAGLDPEHGVLRWGNYDMTMLLSSKIFEADDTGRSYRMRPCTDAIWLREITVRGVLMFFLVPDGPGLAEAIKGTPAIPVWESRQSTNSWGLRGPEPDCDAPVRVLVLGDSFMQGLFIGDHDTPPECLSRDLEARLKRRVSVLNTGVMGYSPEQYYYSLTAFVDKFRPHFVVVSVFGNDFANSVSELAMRGRADWDEAAYWLKKIVQTCRDRNVLYLVVPIPYEPLLLGRRIAGHYPGNVSNILEESSLNFLDPSDDLIDAHLQLVVDGERNGEPPHGCPLFNVKYHDGHFSALGASVWAETVGRRVALLLEPSLPSVTETPTTE